MDKQTLRSVELLLGITAIGMFALWLTYALQNPTITIGHLFLHWYFFVFLSSMILITVLQLLSFRTSINDAERAIFEIIVYRKMTPINAIANRLQISKDNVFEIIQKMIVSYKIIGRIEDGIYHSNSPRTPVCPICKEDILSSLRLITCPICRKPFHKDHLMGYLKDFEEKCPVCKNPITLGDLFID